ncbi:atpG [Symbiodinium natans]|uniref:AtpG protein n=1 Tax=Symbiodinium natans TaxID=878477 RepID=A0A812P442_9DINO|nr:atpG [Symbiodinium natans]
MPKEASVDAGACTVFSNLCPSPCYDSLMNLPGSGKTYTISIFFAEVTSILQAREEAAEALRRDISRAQASPEHLWRSQLNAEGAQDLETQQQSCEEEDKDSKVAIQKAPHRVYSARDDEQAQAYVEDVISKTKMCMRQIETERHYVAMHRDLIAERHQATKTEAQARMKLHEEKSKKQVKELEHMRHQLRLRSDEALAEKMARTQGELLSAKAFCAQVQTDMEAAIRDAQTAAARIEAEAAANTFEEKRKLQDLENNALQSFKGSLDEAQGAWDETSMRRKALQEELDEIHAQYQKIHDETQTKMSSIMAQWNESREGMEKKIADFELKRKDAFEHLEGVIQRF